jgi:hypothetical protein
MSNLFNTCVAVSGERNENGNVRKFCIAVSKACVLDGSMDESIADTAIESGRRAMTVCVRYRDWAEKTPPQKGDVVNIDGKRFGVTKVGDIFRREWVLDCRG